MRRLILMTIMLTGCSSTPTVENLKDQMYTLEAQLRDLQSDQGLPVMQEVQETGTRQPTLEELEQDLEIREAARKFAEQEAALDSQAIEESFWSWCRKNDAMAECLKTSREK